MESKKLFEELFEEEENVEEYAGATDAQCHNWYVYGVLGDALERVHIHVHYGINIVLIHQDIKYNILDN